MFRAEAAAHLHRDAIHERFQPRRAGCPILVIHALGRPHAKMDIPIPRMADHEQLAFRPASHQFLFDARQKARHG